MSNIFEASLGLKDKASKGDNSRFESKSSDSESACFKFALMDENLTL